MKNGNMVVAIVDDDPAVRRALSRLVRSLSCDTVTFSSGEEFLSGIEHHKLGCVLLDLHMPGLGGLDVLLHLEPIEERIPAIVITGFDEHGVRDKCLEAGARDYLIKPLERARVASALELALAT